MESSPSVFTGIKPSESSDLGTYSERLKSLPHWANINFLLWHQTMNKLYLEACQPMHLVCQVMAGPWTHYSDTAEYSLNQDMSLLSEITIWSNTRKTHFFKTSNIEKLWSSCHKVTTRSHQTSRTIKLYCLTFIVLLANFWGLGYLPIS